MSGDQNFNEQLLLAALKFDSHEAFSLIFRRYYTDLVLFAGSFFVSQADCEDIVQNVFYKIWKERKTLDITRSLKSYLFKLVQNQCLDELRHKKVKLAYETYAHKQILALSPHDYILHAELKNKYDDIIAKMPSAEREAFLLSRVEQLKYAEIAIKLNVSVRTVEVRISNALKFLKLNLKNFLSIVMLLLSQNFN
ncbi:MAG: RNA polymerase sigma-70 factor [Clostridiales bacterium]|nr:RNA polymerase sigma-70 factor [Clostridiales bacterium]